MLGDVNVILKTDAVVSPEAIVPLMSVAALAIKCELLENDTVGFALMVTGWFTIPQMLLVFGATPVQNGPTPVEELFKSL